MNPEETLDLLIHTARFDRRTIGIGDAEAWHLVLEPYVLGECEAAVAGWYREHREFVTPADVRELVRRRRQDEHLRALPATIPTCHAYARVATTERTPVDAIERLVRAMYGMDTTPAARPSEAPTADGGTTPAPVPHPPHPKPPESPSAPPPDGHPCEVCRESWQCDATGDLCPACVRDIAASVNALGPACPGCALVESACRRQGGRCCELCQHGGEGK